MQTASRRRILEGGAWWLATDCSGLGFLPTGVARLYMCEHAAHNLLNIIHSTGCGQGCLAALRTRVASAT